MWVALSRSRDERVKEATVRDSLEAADCTTPDADFRFRGFPVSIARATARWRRGEIGAATFASLYFLFWQVARHGNGFAARKRKHGTRPNFAAWLHSIDAADRSALSERLHDGLENHQFRGVRASVPTTLCRWLRGRWPLVACEEIPSPVAVLRAQARGTRPVTIISAYPRMREPVLTKPDGFAFFLHDLEHAYKFFHAPALHAGQRAFFAALEAAFDRGIFVWYRTDPVFARKFDYLMSDMNTHPQHSRLYLRAILIESALSHEGKSPSGSLSRSSRRVVDGAMRAVAEPVALAAEA
jgi:hypothetical protein